VKEEAGSRDKVKHIEKSDQLFVEMMMYVDGQKLQVMKIECCGEVERSSGGTDIKAWWS